MGHSENSSNFRSWSNERDTNKGGKSQSNSKNKVKCYYCKKFEHYKSECPKLRNKVQANEPSFSPIAGAVKENYENLEFVLAITVSNDSFYDKWVFDTCTFHMAHKRD